MRLDVADGMRHLLEGLVQHVAYGLQQLCVGRPFVGVGGATGFVSLVLWERAVEARATG